MLKQIIASIQFMTRIPININMEMDEKTFGRSSRYFTLIGAIIGSILIVIAYLSNKVFQPFTTAVIILVSEMILTGGLHLDGYMDTCDGLLSGRKKERIFEIMKDSRVGAMGITGFFILVILKISLYTELASSIMYPIIFTMPIIGRWTMIYTITFFPYAREDGLGNIFKKEADKKSFLLVSLISALPFILFLPKMMLISIPLTTILSLIFINGINKKLNGHTGDTYGAVNEITEILYLFVSIVIWKTIL